MTLNANRFLYSQLFSNAVWVKTNITLTSGQTDPSAGTEAFTLTAGAANATMLQSLVLAESLNRTVSLYLKRKTGTGDISLTVDGSTYEVVAITGSWVRYDVTLTASGTVTAGIKIATSGDEVYAAWAQLEDGLRNDLRDQYGEPLHGNADHGRRLPKQHDSRLCVPRWSVLRDESCRGNLPIGTLKTQHRGLR